MFSGTVTRYLPDTDTPELDLYEVIYEDDDTEELTHAELTSLARPRSKAMLAFKNLGLLARQEEYDSTKRGNKRDRGGGKNRA